MWLWCAKIGFAFTIGLWVLASLALGLPRSIVDPLDSEVQTLIGISESCAQPCWQGIRPATTSSTDAIARLNAMPWVVNISAIQGIVTNDSIIRWKWSGQQAKIIDGERDGTIWLHNGLVYSIEIPLKISFASIWQAVGKPQDTLIIKAPRAMPAVFYHAYYAAGLIDIYGITPCPLSAWNLFSMPVDAHFASEKAPNTPLTSQTIKESRALCK